MNPLTVQGRRNYRRERMTDTAVCIGCGVVFAALFISFLL